jgi:hypothetical protein
LAPAGINSVNQAGCSVSQYIPFEKESANLEK